MTFTIPTADAATVTVDVSAPVPTSAGRGWSWWRVRAGTSAAVLVALALTLAVVHFVWLMTDYRNLYAHPDYYTEILDAIVPHGISISWHDLPDALKNRAEGEFRPRWLMYLFEQLDHKLRLQLYQWLPVHPTVQPASWPLLLLVTPYVLYKLITTLTQDRLAALASLAVYLTGTGFLSGFTWR